MSSLFLFGSGSSNFSFSLKCASDTNLPPSCDAIPQLMPTCSSTSRIGTPEVSCPASSRRRPWVACFPSLDTTLAGLVLLEREAERLASATPPTVGMLRGFIAGAVRERAGVEVSDSPNKDTGVEALLLLLAVPCGCPVGLLDLERGCKDAREKVLEAGEEALVKVWAVIGFGLLRPVTEP